MKRTFLAMAMFLSLSMGVEKCFAQLKVNGENGKVIIGKDRVDDAGEDFGKVLSMSVFGNNGFYRAGSKLAFGDFGRYDRWGWNVFIGEKDSLDTDQLWMHGKNGFTITYGRADADYKLISFDVNNPTGLYFGSEIIVQGMKVPADNNTQQDVNPLKDAYERVIKLEPLSYKLIPREKRFANSSLDTSDRHVISNTESVLNTSSEQSLSEVYSIWEKDKEENDITFFEAWDKQLKNTVIQKNGFDIENMKELFPELVTEDNNGVQYVDYIGLIPVLIQAIKEQSQIITAQSLKIKEVDFNADAEISSYVTAQDSVNTKSLNNISNEKFSNTFLYQNSPNPFNTTTEIKYFLSESSPNAYIYIFDMQGAMLLNYQILTKGFGKIVLDSSTLSAGMYIYALVVDGKQIDAKRMILTK